MTKHIIPGIIEYTLERSASGKTIYFQVQWQEPKLRKGDDVPNPPELSGGGPLQLLRVCSAAHPELQSQVVFIQGRRTHRDIVDGEDARTDASFATVEQADLFEKRVILSIQAWADIPGCKKYFKGVVEHEQMSLFE